ncbi:hypothetical protein GOV13_05420 [Candidatus Pacearchaeota archaeon]|nr:hypothetical protein [Candidatus Pacearchaeota archaeon]
MMEKNKMERGDNPNELEKSARNKNDDHIFLGFGALGELIFPGGSVFAGIVGTPLVTYISSPFADRLNGFQTPQEEMILYSVKNAARFLTGATAISILRYLS